MVCDANAGTFTHVGNTICQGDALALITNGDWGDDMETGTSTDVLEPPASDGDGFNGVFYGVYATNVIDENPLVDQASGNLIGIAGSSPMAVGGGNQGLYIPNNTAILSANGIFPNTPYYFTTIYGFDIDDGIVGLDLDNNGSAECSDVNTTDVVEVVFLEDITAPVSQVCNDNGTVSLLFTLSGGLPAYDGSSFNITGDGLGGSIANGENYMIASHPSNSPYGIIVSDANGCSQTFSGVTVDTSLPSSCNSCNYTLTTDTTYCNELDGVPPVVCIPLIAFDTLTPGIIGMDYCLEYDETLMTPTGNITLGNVVLDGSVEADYYVNASTNPGKIFISIYYTTDAPIGAAFTGLGEVACVEFTLNSNFTAGTTADFELCEILESYELGVAFNCGDPGSFTLENDDILEGRIIYWNDDSRPLRYDPINTLDYLRTTLFGVDAACSYLGYNFETDINGNFLYDITNGSSLEIRRDIEGDDGNGGCITDVMSTINGMDCYITSLVTTQNFTFLPNVFQLIAMDVNMDGYVSAGDITQIQNRIVQNTCEFPQVWNYPNPIVPSKDWRFVDDYLLNNDLAYTISSTYPSFDGQGYSRLSVPDVPFCLEVQVDDFDVYCSSIDSMTYHSILLGDTDGTWDGNTVPVAIKMNTTEKLIFDFGTAKTEDCRVKIPVYSDSPDALLALDFTLDFNKEALNFVEVERLVADDSKVGIAWNVKNGQQLLLTSYAKQAAGLSTNDALFQLVFELNENTLTEADFGAIKAYRNGTVIQTEITSGQAGCTTVAVEDVWAPTGEWLIYPTPVNDVLILDFSNLNQVVTEVTLYDSLGKILKSIPVKLNSDILELDLHDLPTGIYFVRINDVTKKIVKL